MGKTSEAQRLFFALWPNAAIRERCAAVGDAAGVPTRARTPVENLHVTLVFLGQVRPEARACLEAGASNLIAQGFTLVLDELCYWPRRRFLWLGATQTPPSLSDLVANLQAHAAACGHAVESRPYRAHMTLARRLSPRSPTPFGAEIVWPVSDFALVESVTGEGGSRYHVLTSWRLGSA